MHALRAIMQTIGRQWRYLSYLLLLIITFAFFIYLHGIPTFPDPDSFYHIKMAQLIPEEGIISKFPWLQATILRDQYIDQHFLYHLLLIPFVQWLDPVVGAKLSQVLLSVGFFTLFYWFLRSHRIKFSFVFTLILLVTSSFVFRMSLVKAPVISLLLLFLGLFCLFRYRTALLFLLSFVYVWAYGGFVLILIAAGLYAGVSVLLDWVRGGVRRGFFTVMQHSRELRLFWSALGGTLAGILINPQFPNNIVFYWHQLVKIGIVNYQKIIPVGNEWYPYKLVDLLSNSGLVTVLVVGALVVLLVRPRFPTKKLATLFLLFVFFFAFTLKSRRYIEYFIPFAITFSAFALHQLLYRYSWRQIRQGVAGFFLRYRVVSVILLVYICVSVPAIVARDTAGLWRDYQGGISVHRFAGAGAWLQAHSQPGDIVFHSSWDEFPILFYRSSTNYYIAGLDPTFTYEYSATLYREMVDITLGRTRERLLEKIRNDFHAQYVFVESSHVAMRDAIRNTPGFNLVYSDAEAWIYSVSLTVRQ